MVSSADLAPTQVILFQNYFPQIILYLLVFMRVISIQPSTYSKSGLRQITQPQTFCKSLHNVYSQTTFVSFIEINCQFCESFSVTIFLSIQTFCFCQSLGPTLGPVLYGGYTPRNQIRIYFVEFSMTFSQLTIFFRNLYPINDSMRNQFFLNNVKYISNIKEYFNNKFTFLQPLCVDVTTGYKKKNTFAEISVHIH